MAKKKIIILKNAQQISMFKCMTYHKFKHIFNNFHSILNNLHFACKWPCRPKRVALLIITEYNKYLSLRVTKYLQRFMSTTGWIPSGNLLFRGLDLCRFLQWMNNLLVNEIYAGTICIAVMWIEYLHFSYTLFTFLKQYLHQNQRSFCLFLTGLYPLCWIFKIHFRLNKRCVTWTTFKGVWITSDISKWFQLWQFKIKMFSLTFHKSLYNKNIKHSNVITDVLFCISLWLATSN